MPDRPLSTRNRPQSPNHPVRLQARERDRQALEMRMTGMTFQAIGDALGFSQQAAQKAVTRSLEITKGDIAEKSAELRAIEVERLEKVTEVLWPMVLEGDLRAIDRFLRTRESFRRLTGIDLEKAPDTSGVGATYVVHAGGDINLVPPGGDVVDLRPPWSRPENQRDVIEGQAVLEPGEGP
jgi:hypothetical protein